MESYLQIESLTKSFGDLVLFENITFSLNKGNKVALVAANGTGKTTLMNIISRNDSADSGEVSFIKDITIGYLPQEPVLDPEKSVLAQVFSTGGALSNAIQAYEQALNTNDKSSLQNAMDEMDRLNGWAYEQRAKEILSRLKITEFDQKVKQLSGGQKKRVALATVLINNPDLLILDEPTNHLDLDMIEWIEEFLSGSNVTLFMVTHDRYFLDRVCNTILEMDNKTLYRYDGNYSYYLQKRQQRIENEELATDKARNLLSTEIEWMRRQPKARGTKAKYRVEAFYGLQEQASGQPVKKEMDLNVKASRLGKKILEVHGLTKKYDNNTLVNNFSYKFSRFEKAGIIGSNGTGKSTLLNLLTGSILPDQGDVETGETVVFGYYHQEGIQFDPKKKVIDAVTDIAEVVTLGDGKTIGVSQFLNYFLFPPPVQHNFIEKLSGGEKRRLYLVTVLMKNPNFLLLDEPTNDLDIPTLQVLEDYLKSFNGCLVVVSHDRFFMDKIIDHLFVFEGDGKIKDFPGNYSQYRDKVQAGKKLEQTEKTLAKPSKKQEIKKGNTTSRAGKLSFKDQREYDLLTKDIQTLETEKYDIEKKIGSGMLEQDELLRLSEKLGELLKQIDAKTDRWMELEETLNP